jgi:hypothetical protein
MTSSAATNRPAGTVKSSGDTALIQGQTCKIAARPRQAVDETRADRVGDIREHNGHRASRPLQGLNAWGGRSQNDIGRERQQFLGVSLKATSVARCPAMVDPKVAPGHVAAAPPRSPRASRRDAPTMAYLLALGVTICERRAAAVWPARRTVSLPQTPWQVPETDLNCSE